MAAYEVLLLNTSIPQIQAAQSGDTYVVPRDIAINATATITGNLGLGATSTTGYWPANLTQTAARQIVSYSDATTNLDNANAGLVIFNSNSTAGSSSKLVFGANNSDPVPVGLAYISAVNSTRSSGYLSGSLVFGTAVGGGGAGTGPTERMRLDSSGNLGLGVTPSAWDSANYKALQVSRAALVAIANVAILSGNWYADTGGDKYIANGFANRIDVNNNGQIQFKIAGNNTSGANAPLSFTQAMTLDASGNLAVGNTNLSALLHVGKVAQDADVAVMIGNGATSAYSASTATLQFRHGGNGGATLNAGKIVSGRTGNYYSAADADSYLAFYTALDNTDTEHARITSGGDFLVGDTTTAATSGPGFKVLTPVSGHWDPLVVTSGNNASYTCWDIYSTNAGAYRFYVTTTGVINATSTTISAISDQRLKENIRDLDVGLNAVLALKPRKFDWKAGKGKDIKGDRGWIAQEFEQVFPDMIDEWKDPAPEGEEPYKSVRADLIPVLVKAIQEQQAMINELKAEVAALKGV